MVYHCTVIHNPIEIYDENEEELAELQSSRVVSSP